MANPYYGWHGDPGARGDTAKRRRQYDPPGSQVESDRPTQPCPGCGARVRWQVDRDGSVEMLEGGMVHVCDLDRSLHYLGRRKPEELLTSLRRIINHRRMYGAAV